MRGKLYLIMVLIILANVSLNANSLWNSDKNNKSLYEDKKARDVGDILSIVIRENASATQTASDNKTKQGQLKGNAGTGLLNLIPDLGASGSSSLANADTTKRSGNLSAMVSAKIEKKDANGNLFVKGIRKVLINNEQQEIEISGFVRPENISSTNSVESSYLADAEVKYNGKLVFDGKANPGIVSDILGSIIGFFF